MCDAWLERQVERRVATVQSRRLDAHLDESIDPARCEPAVVRKELHEALTAALGSALPPELSDLWAKMHACRRFSDDAPSEEARQALVDAWNKLWFQLYEMKGRLPPSLAGRSLQQLDLRGIHLADADLEPPDDVYVDHGGVDLSQAQLPWINLCGSVLHRGRFVEANLQHACLRGACLAEADLRGADLSHADLRGANLTGADLSDAKLAGADFTGAKMLGAILNGADLRQVVDLAFDENSVINAKFTNRAGIVWRGLIALHNTLAWMVSKTPVHTPADQPLPPVHEDRWSAMRRCYSGPSFFISLLFLVSFALPYMLQTFFLVQLSRAESPLVLGVEGLTGKSVALASATPEEAAAARTKLSGQYAQLKTRVDDAAAAMERIRDMATAFGDNPDPAAIGQMRTASQASLDAIRAARLDVDQLRTTLADWAVLELRSRRSSVWRTLIGLDSGNVGWSILVVALVLYNGAKWVLTTTVATMREAEDRSRVTPASAEYRVLIPFHAFVSVMYWVALVIGLGTFITYMVTPVYRLW